MWSIIIQCSAIILSIRPISCHAKEAKRPNIIFILADDLGFNDVGFHGSNEIPTPNIDALAYSGVILNRYSMPSSGVASRSALMTGKYPIHTGMQHGNLYSNETRGLPLNEKILPEYFKDLGYVTRMVGKWHLGHYKKEYTPTYRGFDSHMGFWTEYQDYFDHTSVQGDVWGYDMRRNMDIAYDLHGQYTTDIFTNEAVRIIHEHKPIKPLFLYVAHAAVHTGNPYNPLPACDEDVALFDSIDDFYRRKYAAMVKKLDESVGEIVSALKETNLLAKSIIVFSTDNGGPIYINDAKNKRHFNVASNWPLRGGKRTLFEGGVRGVGFIWSPYLKETQRILMQPFDMTDWLPTLYHVAGGDMTDLGENIDGIDSWKTLSENVTTNRSEILHNMDDIDGTAALTVGDYKIIMGPDEHESKSLWYTTGDSKKQYDLYNVINSIVGKILSDMDMEIKPKKINDLRRDAQLRRICPNITKVNDKIKCELNKAPCMFNIKTDPCEFENLANKNLEIFGYLKNQLNKYKDSAVLPSNVDGDPRINPQHWGHIWTYFDDNGIGGEQKQMDALRKDTGYGVTVRDAKIAHGVDEKITKLNRNKNKISITHDLPQEAQEETDLHHHYFVFV